MSLHRTKILRDAKIGSTILQGSRAGACCKDLLQGSKSDFKETDKKSPKFERKIFKEKQIIPILLDMPPAEVRLGPPTRFLQDPNPGHHPKS